MKRNKYKGLVLWVLSIGMLLMGCNTYSKTVLITKQTINGKTVINCGDTHENDPGSVPLDPSAYHGLNQCLKNWINELRKGKEKTLFIIESCEGQQRTGEDTLPLLDQLSSNKEGNVVFKRADRRKGDIGLILDYFFMPLYQINSVAKSCNVSIEKAYQKMPSEMRNKADLPIQHITTYDYLNSIKKFLQGLQMCINNIKVKTLVYRSINNILTYFA